MLVFISLKCSLSLTHDWHWYSALVGAPGMKQSRRGDEEGLWILLVQKREEGSQAGIPKCCPRAKLLGSEGRGHSELLQGNFTAYTVRIFTPGVLVTSVCREDFPRALGSTVIARETQWLWPLLLMCPYVDIPLDCMLRVNQPIFIY